jgi:hypothetical protein
MILSLIALLVSLDYVITTAINVVLEKIPSSSSVINTFHDLATIIAPSDTIVVFLANIRTNVHAKSPRRGILRLKKDEEKNPGHDRGNEKEVEPFVRMLKSHAISTLEALRSTRQLGTTFVLSHTLMGDCGETCILNLNKYNIVKNQHHRLPRSPPQDLPPQIPPTPQLPS